MAEVLAAQSQDDGELSPATDEVEGYAGTLFEARNEGSCEQPEPMVWNTWQTWESKYGLRPPSLQGPAGVKRDALLRRSVMAELGGGDLRELTGIRTPVQSLADVAAAQVVLKSVHPGEGSASEFSEGLWRSMSDPDLWQMMKAPFDAEVDDIRQYERQLLRAHALLSSRSLVATQLC